MRSVLWSFVNFCKYPIIWEKRTVREIIKLWSAVYLGVMIISAIVTSILSKWGISADPDLLRDFVIEGWVWKVLLTVVVIGPLIEELMFRLPQKYHIRNISISIAGFVYLWYTAFGGDVISDYLDMYHIDEWWRMIFVLLVILVLGGIVRLLLDRYEDKLSSFWTKYSRWIVFGLTAIFGLVHISNFSDGWRYRYVIWLMIIPQFVLWYMLSFVRRNRWWIAWWILHWFHNLISFVPILLMKKALGDDINALFNTPEKAMEIVSSHPQVWVYGMLIGLLFITIFVISIWAWIEWIKESGENKLPS